MLLRNFLYIVIILLIIVFTSAASSRLWAGKEETPTENIKVNINKDMTVAELGNKHGLNQILLKGILWAFFLTGVFILIRKGRITSRNRKWVYMAAVGVFGVILGSDPSPMGTVKDAILKQDRIIPDCFSCRTCMETCPAEAISFGRGKRQKPPAGKFDKAVISVKNSDHNLCRKESLLNV